MYIKDCIENSFKLTNRYIVLATPLILFSLLSSLYLIFSINGSFISLLIAVVLFTLMSAAFIAGWCYMIKFAVKNPNLEAVNSLIKEFTAGVGEYFLPALGLIVNIFVFTILMLFLTYIVGMKFVGNVGISPDAMAMALKTPATLKAFLLSLTEEQLMKFNLWNLLLFLAMGLEYFLIMFYLPVQFFKTKNPFVAFAISIKDLFCRKFFSNLGLYSILFASYFLLSILSVVFSVHVIMHFLYTLINFYYLVFIAVLVFNYYYRNFIEIGGNIDKIIED